MENGQPCPSEIASILLSQGNVSLSSPMCKEGGPPVRKFCPTHLPAPPPPPHHLEELLFPASLQCPRTADTGACQNPWLSELVDIRLCQGPTASLAVGRD